MTHYLEAEFYAKVREDTTIIDFLQQGSLDGIWYWDLETSDDEWYSPRLVEVLGYNHEEVPSRSSWWQEHIFPEDKQLAFDNYARHLEDPSHPYDQVVRYRHRDGGVVWVRCRGIIIRDSDGTPKRMLGAHTDVTALKRTEEALAGSLQAARSRYEELYESSPDMYVSVDAKTACVKLCNRTTVEKLGYDHKSELIGLPIFDLYHPAAHPRAKQAFQSFVTTGFVDNARLELRRRDGTPLPVLLNVKAIRDDQGNIVESISTWRDISSLVELEKLKTLTARLEESNRDLETFAYVASHDLKEPLRMVSSFSSLLASEYKDQLDERGQMFLRHLENGAGRMQEMLDAVLEWGRAGYQTATVPCDLNEVVSEAMTFVGTFPEAANLTVAPDLPAVRADKAAVVRVFANILSNAIKYRASSRPLQVSISWAQDGHETRVDVQDNGIGFEPSFNARVMEPFKRLHHRGQYAGSGIGLAVVDRTMERLGGRAKAFGKPDEGACISLWFPQSLPAPPRR